MGVALGDECGMTTLKSFAAEALRNMSFVDSAPRRSERKRACTRVAGDERGEEEGEPVGIVTGFGFGP